jgi:tetratricopeptide (TPR) repeat protein
LQGNFSEAGVRVLEPLYAGCAVGKPGRHYEKYLHFVKDPEERISLYKRFATFRKITSRIPKRLQNVGARFRCSRRRRGDPEKLESLAANGAVPDLVDVYALPPRKLARKVTQDESARNLAIQIWLKAPVSRRGNEGPRAPRKPTKRLALDPRISRVENLMHLHRQWHAANGRDSDRRADEPDSYDRSNSSSVGYVRELITGMPAAVAALEAVLREVKASGRAWAWSASISQPDFKALFSVYERMSKAFSSDDEVAEALAHMAKIASDALKNPLGAKDLWKRVLEIKGDETRALRELANLSEAAHDWPGCVEYLKRITEASYDTNEQVEAYLAVGRIAHNELKDHARRSMPI